MPNRRKAQKGKIMTSHDLGFKVENRESTKYVAMEYVIDVAHLKKPKPEDIRRHIIDHEAIYAFEDRRKGERRSGVDRRTNQVSPIGEVKGKDVFVMSEAEFVSHKNPPERITSKKKLRELGVKKGQVAFKARREDKERRE